MYLIAILSAFIAVLSPFWGLIFILSFGEKYRDRKGVFFAAFSVVVIIFFFLKIIDTIGFFDLIIGIALSSMLYFWSLFRTLDYLRSIIAVFFLNIGYAVLRNLIFGKLFITNLNQALQQYTEFVKTSFENNTEYLSFALEILRTLENILSKYYAGIWIITIVLAVYFGSLIFSKKNELKWNHRLIQLPFFFIYLLIGSLALFLIPNTRTVGINCLMMLSPLFLIQGISIIDFYWGNFFKKSKFLLFLLIFSMVLNYFILMLIALMGLVDIWFNFRKIIIMEEIDENNLN